MKQDGHISIWFFVGLLLDVYGVLITGAGIYGLWHPPDHEVVLWNLHAGVWWGALILCLGIVYTWFFRPSRERARRSAERAAGE